jgi:hypothetical protein
MIVVVVCRCRICCRAVSKSKLSGAFGVVVKYVCCVINCVVVVV